MNATENKQTSEVNEKNGDKKAGKNNQSEHSGEENVIKREAAEPFDAGENIPAERKEEILNALQRQRGKDIRNWRIQQGFTAKQLAKRLSISTNTLRSWEEGSFLNWARLNALVNIGFPSDKAFPPL